jgi:hypothetical protein
MSNQQPPKVLLYFSKRCGNSRKLLSELSQSGFSFDQNTMMFVRKQQQQGKINMIAACCIDNPQIKRPNWLQVVPTLYTTMVGRPLNDDDMYEWLYSYVLISQQNHQQQNHQQQQPQRSQYVENNEITGDSAISPYLGMEMGSKFSDMYSLISERDDHLDKSDGAMEGTFSGITHGNDDLEHHKSTIWRRTVPITRHSGPSDMPLGGSGNTANNTAKKNDKGLDKAYESFLSNRKNDMPKGNHRVGGL